MARRLTRSADDKIIAGVCSGLARYFNIDPVIIRVIWGVSFFPYGIGLLPYLIFCSILPEE